MSDTENKSISGGKKKKRKGINTGSCTGTGAPSSFSLVQYKFQPQTSSERQQQLPPSPGLAQKYLLTFVSALNAQHTAFQEENQAAGTIRAQTPHFNALRLLQIFKVFFFPLSNAKTTLAEGYERTTIIMLKESLKCKENFPMLLETAEVI